MSEKDPIKIFVTHNFEEEEDYLRVFEYLESRDRFFYVNCSAPDPTPDGGLEAQQEELRNQIQRCEGVICPIGVDGISRLVVFQLTVAEAFNKPIVAINRFGGGGEVPDEIKMATSEIVDWNDREITDAVRRTARGEDTNSWDVVEFDPDEFS